MENTDKIRLFMTSLLDGHGNIVLMGEEVSATDTTIELKHPLRLVINDKGVVPATFFNAKEWIKVPVASCVEMDIHEKIVELYIAYVEDQFGAGIIMPEEKKIILI